MDQVSFLAATSLVVLAVCVQHATGNMENGCPEGWTLAEFETGNKCLKFFPERVKFKRAHMNCKNLPGRAYLSMPKTQEMCEYIHTGYRQWLGLSEKVWSHDKTGHWIWSDGTKLEWSAWGPDEPNYHGWKAFCVQMKTSGEWKDAGCNQMFPYHCEMDPIVCPEGYDVVYDRCLSLHKQRQYFEDAADECKKRGATLLTEISQDFAKKLFDWDKIKNHGPGWNVWAGLSNTGTRDYKMMAWVDGKPVDNDGKPSNKKILPWYPGRIFKKAGRCVTFNRENQQFVDYRCDTKRVHYVCEAEKLNA